jgi:hypothetical protein
MADFVFPVYENDFQWQQTSFLTCLQVETDKNLLFIFGKRVTACCKCLITYIVQMHANNACNNYHIIPLIIMIKIIIIPNKIN